MTLIIDTREQKPLDFSRWADVRTVRQTHWPGDYSLQAGTHLLAVERKSVSDLIGTMSQAYAGFGATSPKRFDAELRGLGGVIHAGGRAFVLVEPDHPGMTAVGQILAGAYRAQIPPEKIIAFINRIRTAWKVPVVLAVSREHAAELVVAAARAAEAEKRAWRSVDEQLVAESRQRVENGPRIAPREADGKSIIWGEKRREGAFSSRYEGGTENADF